MGQRTLEWWWTEMDRHSGGGCGTGIFIYETKPATAL